MFEPGHENLPLRVKAAARDRRRLGARHGRARAGSVVDRLRARKILASTSPYAVTYARISAGIMVQPGEVERTIGEIAALAA